MNKWRRKIIAIWMVFLFLVMTRVADVESVNATFVYDYITNNFLQDTGAVNAVTGIYLDYRVFDTLFETLLLLVSVIGIIYFSRHEGDY